MYGYTFPHHKLLSETGSRMDLDLYDSGLPKDPKIFVAQSLSRQTEGDQLSFLKRDLETEAFLYDLSLDWKMNSKACFYAEISEDQAFELLRHSRLSSGIADAGKEIATHNLINDGPLPPSLREFVALALNKQLPKGKKGRKRGGNYERDYWIWSTINTLSDEYDMAKTRNEASDVLCACDLVAHEIGEHENLKFDRVVDIFFEMEKSLNTSESHSHWNEFIRRKQRGPKER